jgi:subtilisin family serine protease
MGIAADDPALRRLDPLDQIERPIGARRDRREQRMFGKHLLTALLLTTVAATAFADGAAAGLRGRSTPPASAPVAAARPAAAPGSKDRLHLIFRDGTDVRLRGGRLVSLSDSIDLSAVQSILDRLAGTRVERLFSLSEVELAKLKNDGEKRTGKKSPDLNLEFLVRLPKGADSAAVSRDLAALDVVRDAYAEPLPVEAPTADYVGDQTYRNAAPDGINLAAAAGLPGATGSKVKIIDIENGWNTNHEDLAKARGGLIVNGTPVTNYPTDHGTAVLGELIGTPNGFGVTGIAPDAAIAMVNSYTQSGTVISVSFANAMVLATANAGAGDVILIEQHYGGPRSVNNVGNSQFGYLPVEYWSAYYDAIRAATQKGIIVVEAAGNGEQNLDDPIYGGVLSVGGPRLDSGAILVGAGNAPGCDTEPARSRTWFSNYGSRVDVQAWGECVVTTGYKELQNLPNANYTNTFSGTSSASPIIAGAAAVLSSLTEARTGTAASPSKVRSALKTGGSPQTSGTYNGNIGSMPDLGYAMTAMAGDTTAPVVGAIGQSVAPGAKASAATVPTAITWSATDANGILAYAARVKVNGGGWQSMSLPSATATAMTLDLTPGTTYQFSIAARDKVGIWSAWKDGTAFTPTLISEAKPGVGYSTTGWTNPAPYSLAIGGAVAVSGTTGAWASVTFTGRNIAWIGTKATNRGQADIWLDNAYVGRIDLYSATDLPSTVLYSANVTTGQSHTLILQVVGTAGRPKVDIDGFAILK